MPLMLEETTILAEDGLDIYTDWTTSEKFNQCSARFFSTIDRTKCDGGLNVGQ